MWGFFFFSVIYSDFHGSPNTDLVIKSQGKPQYLLWRQLSSTEWKMGLCIESSVTLYQQRAILIYFHHQISKNKNWTDTLRTWCLACFCWDKHKVFSIIEFTSLIVTLSMNSSTQSEIINPPWTNELGLEQPLSSIHGKKKQKQTNERNIFLTSLSLLTLTNCLYLLVKVLHNILKVRICE